MSHGRLEPGLLDHVFYCKDAGQLLVIQAHHSVYNQHMVGIPGLHELLFKELVLHVALLQTTVVFTDCHFDHDPFEYHIVAVAEMEYLLVL